MPATTTPPSVDPRHIDLLIARADAPVASSLHALPSDAACRAVLAELRPALALRSEWAIAVGHATRLAAVLPAARADTTTIALAISELGKAFAAYPPAVAQYTADRLMEICRFRPVPAEVHDVAKRRTVDLRIAEAMAERVLEARAAAAEERVARELDHQDTIRRQRADAGHTGGTRSRDARRNPLKSLDPSEANAFARRIDENIETVVVVEGARGREAGDGPGRLDITAGDEIVAAVTDELVPDGHRLRGDVLAASVALGWLRSGYDLQRDILPGVRLAMQGQHRISQWRSLTGWIANVHADRAAAEKARPPPPESSHPDPVVSPSRSRHDQPSIVEIGQAIARHDYAAVR